MTGILLACARWCVGTEHHRARVGAMGLYIYIYMEGSLDQAYTPSEFLWYFEKMRKMRTLLCA